MADASAACTTQFRARLSHTHQWNQRCVQDRQDRTWLDTEKPGRGKDKPKVRARVLTNTTASGHTYLITTPSMYDTWQTERLLWWHAARTFVNITVEHTRLRYNTNIHAAMQRQPEMRFVASSCPSDDDQMTLDKPARTLT